MYGKEQIYTRHRTQRTNSQVGDDEDDDDDDYMLRRRVKPTYYTNLCMNTIYTNNTSSLRGHGVT